MRGDFLENKYLLRSVKQGGFQIFLDFLPLPVLLENSGASLWQQSSDVASSAESSDEWSLSFYLAVFPATFSEVL